LPLDEKVVVEARGRRFSKDKEAPREYRTQLEPDGSFEVAFAKSTRKGWVYLDARYLYLPKRASVDVRKFEGELVLEPALGGYITGQVEPEPALDGTPDIFDGVSVTVVRWSEGQLRKVVEVDANGHFEVDAVAPATDYEIEASSALFDGESLQDQAIKSGEIHEVHLSLRRGAKIGGRVVGADSEGIEDARVELMLTNEAGGGMRTMGRTENTDEEGKFEFTGLQPGGVELTVRAEAYRELKHEVGSMENGEVVDNLVLAPQRGSVLGGTVRWPDGSAAADAKIEVHQSQGDDQSYWDARTFNAETDDTGAFHIEGLGEGALVVEASARPVPPPATGEKKRRKRGPHWKCRLLDQQPGSTGLLMVLSPGETLVGNVVNELGRPVKKFTIEGRPDENGPNSARNWEDRFTRALNDDAGHFELKGLSPGSWRLRARARGGAETEWTHVEVPNDVPLQLVAPTGAKLSGVVRAPNGDAVAGAKVRAQSMSPGRASISYNDGRKTTDQEGRFGFKGLVVGKVMVRAEAPGFAQSPPLQIDLTNRHEDEDLILTLRRAGRLTGELHPSVGNLGDQQVRANSQEGSYWKNTRTDEDGLFAFEDVPPGQVRVTLMVLDEDEEEGITYHREAGHRTERVEIVEGGSAHVILGTPLENAIRVYGRVTVGGEGAAGFRVSYNKDDFRGTAKTNATGDYEFTVGEPGEYWFNIDGRGNNNIRSRQTIGDVGETRVDIELSTGVIAGIVRLPDGVLAPRVMITLEQDGEKEDRSPMRNTNSDEQGAFRIEYLSAGTYVLRMGGTSFYDDDAASYAAYVQDDLRLDEGQAIEGLEIQLEEGGSVSGVVFAGGAPAEGAWIYAYDDSGHQLSSWPIAVTGADGRFTGRGLPAGSLTLEARNREKASGKTSVHVSVGGTSEVSITMKEG